MVNFLNLLFQLLIAHKLKPPEFASFNSLLSIIMIFSAPLATLQLTLAKYTSEFRAQNQTEKSGFLLASLFKKTSFLAVLTFLLFSFSSGWLTNSLKITSSLSGYILAALLALSWLIPVFLGALQGLELFKLYTSGSVISGILKLVFGFLFMLLGFNAAGALGALLASNLALVVIFYPALRGYFAKSLPSIDKGYFASLYKDMLAFLVPISITQFCFITLVNSDMVLVKYFFNPNEAGLYSLAQMLGKIFLFLPISVSLVMFPKTSGLNARNKETIPTLKRSLFYAVVLCAAALSLYNLFPNIFLIVLTGKSALESVLLGRLFSVSMTFFTLAYILMSYFLSIKETRFLKYLILSCLLQNLAIIMFHRSLLQVQAALCVNSFLLLFVFLFLAFSRKK